MPTDPVALSEGAPAIPTELERELCSILQVDSLPQSLIGDIAKGVQRGVTWRAEARKLDAYWSALQQLELQAQRMRVALDVILATEHPPALPPDPDFPADFLQQRLAAVRTELGELLWTIEATKDPPRLRGRPVDMSRYIIRTGAMRALDHAGVRLSLNARGQAARAVAAILTYADQVLDNIHRPRAEFSGRQWSEWVRDYQQFKGLLGPGR